MLRRWEDPDGTRKETAMLIFGRKSWGVVVILAVWMVVALPAIAHAEASKYVRLNYGEGTVYSVSSTYKWLKASQGTSVDSSSCMVRARIQSRSTAGGTWVTRTTLAVSPGSGGSNSTSYSPSQYWRLTLAASVWGLGSAEGVLNIYD